MPIGEQVTIASHTGNGVATVFAYSFGVLAADDLKVLVNGVEVTTGFTVSGIGSRTGGTVTFSVAPASGTAILIVREVVRKRDTDYQYSGDLREEALDDDLDRIWMTLQEDGELVDRGVRVPVGETLSELPVAASRVDKVLTFGAGGAIALVDIAAFSGGGVVELVPADGSIALVKLTTAVQNLINGALQRSGGILTGPVGLAGDATDDLHPVSKQQFDAGLLLVCPPGSIKSMARLAAPSGWLLIDGGTIGNAASGATARANADTWLLFEQVWAFPAASVPIFDSVGVASVRGASAAADFAANKRLSLFTPDGGAFMRMWTPGQTKDAGRAAGSLQQDAFQGHEHDAYVTAITHTLDGGGLGLGTGNHNGTTFGITNKPGFSPARVADETRPYNLAMPHYIFLGVAT